MSNSTLTLVFQTGGALPVENASFTVKNEQGAVVYQGSVGRGSSGLSEPIVLDTPDRETTLSPDSVERPYSLYTVETRAEGYHDTITRDLQMFADSPSRQVINLLPNARSGVARTGAQIYQIPPHALRQVYTPQAEYSTARILDEVVVPEEITVHLGSPNSSARNVTVPFIDYIKNVASSEIYPTWPEASLRANILAQISLALNRIYTEWYPARGYRYNITNSTAYDQYFVYGRNIYESVSSLAEELFNTYIIKPGREEPFYAEYCNGSTVSCPGMSQWGTVSLAQDGFTPRGILEFYYGDINLVTTNNIESIPESYPGRPLSIGSSGDDVLTLQIQLDRIAINYPAIPLVFADGIFGANTQASVRAFQRIAGLTADGIVGKSTWYAISHYYVAVKKLAELASEGELPVYNDFAFPGVLRVGSRGTGVQEVQFFLNKIAAFNPAVPSQRIDGVYGGATQNAVRAFQTAYGLSADGIVGQATWNALVDEYRGTQNVPVPPEPIVTSPYPGTPVRRGQTGTNVRYVQRLLNAIGQQFRQIGSLTVDGIFGGATESAVRTFQRIFGLSADGIVGPNTWNRLNEIYTAVETCLLSTDTSSLTRPYPGTPVRRGQSGTNVRYVQTALSAIRRVLVTIPALSIDGVFGGQTEASVIAFQRIFGLVDDGIVGPATWQRLNYLYVAVTDGCLTRNAATAFSEETEQGETVAVSAPPIAPGARVGSFGRDVVQIKHALAEKLGVPAASFGDNLLFGLSMRRALENFQAREGIPVTGEADEQTIEKLFL